MGADGELRMTRQRRAILQVVKATECHPTAEEVYRRVWRRLPRIGLATVYRNLERLAEVGALQRLELGRGQMRFESRPEPHAHVRCTRCGGVRDAPEAVLPSPERFPRSWKGFSPGKSRLTVLNRAHWTVRPCPGIQAGNALLFHSQSEHALQIMFAILPKGDQCSRVDDPFDSDHVFGDQLGQLFVFPDTGNSNQVAIPRYTVHFGHSVYVQDFLRSIVDSVTPHLDEHKSGNHDSSLPVTNGSRSSLGKSRRAVPEIWFCIIHVAAEHVKGSLELREQTIEVHITGYCVQLLGICPDCRRNARLAAPTRARRSQRGEKR